MPRGKRSELERWLEQNHPVEIGESEFVHIHAALAPISEGYLRKLLRESGASLNPMVEGVRQDSLDHLERGLRTFTEFYELGDRTRRVKIRKLVITAKDHARLAARSKNATPEKKAEKQEMILWLTTWLENPPLFPAWITLRRTATVS